MIVAFTVCQSQRRGSFLRRAWAGKRAGGAGWTAAASRRPSYANGFGANASFAIGVASATDAGEGLRAEAQSIGTHDAPTRQRHDTTIDRSAGAVVGRGCADPLVWRPF